MAWFFTHVASPLVNAAAQWRSQNDNNEKDMGTNVTQTDAGVSADTPLLFQAPVSAQSTDCFHIANPQSLSLHKEVVINVNGAVRDQPDVGVSHTTPISPRATNSNINIDSSSLPPFENSSGVAHVGSGVSSSHFEKTLKSIARPATDIQSLIIEAKEVANRVVLILSGCIISEYYGVRGNKAAVLMYKYFCNAFTILCYASLASSLGLYGLIKINPATRGFVTIIKFTMYFAQVTLIYAIGCAICILFPSKVMVVVILIIPLVPIGLVTILSFAHRDKRSSIYPVSIKG